MVEIAKALSLDARVIIMDEPTSSLTISETERLLAVVADLRGHGVAIIFITHRLGEIMHCADRVVCLRDGRTVGTLSREQMSHAAMIRLMIGRDLRSLYVPPKVAPREGGCDVVDLVTSAFPDRAVNLHVRHGEILGLAGLVGSGRTSLARALFGVEPILAGEICLDGEAVRIDNPRAAIARGIYLAPEDRKHSGLVLDMPIAQNITLANMARHARAWMIDRAAEFRTAAVQHTALRIKAPDDRVVVGTLSGGNQQKVVLGKWLSMDPRVVIFDEPTRGIDVGAKGEIYDLMRGLAERGVAILMISSDMEEVIGVSDRIAVMHEGRISGVLERPDFSEDNVLRLAIGHALEDGPLEAMAGSH